MFCTHIYNYMIPVPIAGKVQKTWSVIWFQSIKVPVWFRFSAQAPGECSPTGGLRRPRPQLRLRFPGANVGCCRSFCRAAASQEVWECSSPRHPTIRNPTHPTNKSTHLWRRYEDFVQWHCCDSGDHFYLQTYVNIKLIYKQYFANRLQKATNFLYNRNISKKGIYYAVFECVHCNTSSKLC